MQLLSNVISWSFVVLHAVAGAGYPVMVAAEAMTVVLVQVDNPELVGIERRREEFERL